MCTTFLFSLSARVKEARQLLETVGNAQEKSIEVHVCMHVLFTNNVIRIFAQNAMYAEPCLWHTNIPQPDRYYIPRKLWLNLDNCILISRSLMNNKTRIGQIWTDAKNGGFRADVICYKPSQVLPQEVNNCWRIKMSILHFLFKNFTLS